MICTLFLLVNLIVNRPIGRLSPLIILVFAYYVVS